MTPSATSNVQPSSTEDSDGVLGQAPPTDDVDEISVICDVATMELVSCVVDAAGLLRERFERDMRSFDNKTLVDAIKILVEAVADVVDTKRMVEE